jgi:5-deoxy-glucuronate isomerase
MRSLHIPAAQAVREPYAVEVTPESAGWDYSGLRMIELPPGGHHTIETGRSELLVLPLSGGAEVTCGGQRFALAGRAGVFQGGTDFAYLPRDATATISTPDGGRFALPAARCDGPARTPRYGVTAAIESRGAGPSARTIRDICMPETFDGAERLLVCEVLTPGGNWSSYPPHKHDQDRPGETVLEEIYYFQTGGLAYQRVYGDGIDVLAEVRDGDVVLVPHGWHGPSMAPPGYDLYYLNVMAGPVRSWQVSFDPAHAWVRETWRRS